MLEYRDLLYSDLRVGLTLIYQRLHGQDTIRRITDVATVEGCVWVAWSLQTRGDPAVEHFSIKAGPQDSFMVNTLVFEDEEEIALFLLGGGA